MANPEPDVEVTRFVKLLTTNERHLRAFLFQLVVDVHVVDELMQEISTVLWKKFSELEDDEGFLPWAYVVARYEVLMYRRRRARDRLVFDEDLVELLGTEYDKSTAEHRQNQQREWLANCLSLLRDSDRRLLAVAYGREMNVTELAKSLDRTVNSLYKSLGRLRNQLRDCIESKMRASQ